MLSRKAIREKRIQDSLRAFLAVFLLISYTVGNIQIEGIHELFHTQNNIVNHSVEQENDSCHRAIYHQERKDGCEHKSHLTKVGKCSLCHLLFHSDHLAFSDSSCEFIQSGFTVTKEFISVQLAGIDNNLPSRAPPCII